MLCVKKQLIVISSLIIGMSTSVMAEEVPLPSSWKAEAELGYISTSGNTDTETLNAKTKIINERIKWKNTFTAESTRSSDGGNVTAQRSFASAKTDYKFADKSYVFGLLEYENNRFSGYDYQASLIAGYGQKLLNQDDLKWEAELGGGSKQSKQNNVSATTSGIVYVGTELEWKISESSSFNEKLTIESGDATTTKSVTAIKSKFNSKLASKITYTVKHVDKVPAGVKNTDNELAVTLVFNF